MKGAAPATGLRRALAGLAALATLCLGVNAQALELNQANEAELDALRGMGPALNRRVRQARDAQPFTDWPDFLRRVSGVGPAQARALSAQGLTVQGRAYAD